MGMGMGGREGAGSSLLAWLQLLSRARSWLWRALRAGGTQAGGAGYHPRHPPPLPRLSPHTQHTCESNVSCHGAASHPLGRSPAQVSGVKPAAASLEGLRAEIRTKAGRQAGGQAGGQAVRRGHMQVGVAPGGQPWQVLPCGGTGSTNWHRGTCPDRSCSRHYRQVLQVVQAVLQYHAVPWRWPLGQRSSQPSRPAPAPAAAPAARRAHQRGSLGAPPAGRCRGWAGLQAGSRTTCTVRRQLVGVQHLMCGWGKLRTQPGPPPAAQAAAAAALTHFTHPRCRARSGAAGCGGRQARERSR